MFELTIVRVILARYEGQLGPIHGLHDPHTVYNLTCFETKSQAVREGSYENILHLRQMKLTVIR